ncbi:MAG: DUF3987 domain-containing protein [Bacteroidales bacterium]|nr:DUF3987 domain-containing protein [Bacteroidales bacterium]
MSKVTFLELAQALGEEIPEKDEAQEWVADISSEIDYMIPFPCVAQDIQKWILETSYKQQPALSFAAALNVLSVIQGRTIQCQGIKGNIMMLCLAESGEGKDWPMKASRKLLESVGMDDCVHGQMASGAALVDALVDSPSMMLSLDEVGHYFAGINNKNANQYSREIMPIITEVYTSGADWYSEKKRKGQDSRKIHEPNLSMMGMSTERQIMDALKSSEVADGSLARFMVVFGKNNSPINENWNTDSNVPDYIKNRLELIKKPYLISSHKISLSDEYAKVKRELERRFNNKGIELGLSEGDKAMFKPFYYRLAVRSVQMALLIDNCYSIDVLNWCADISEKSCEVFIKKFCHMAADNENEYFVKFVERVIKESGTKGITKDKFYDKTRKVESNLKKRILADLIESNKIFTEEMRIGTAKKPSTLYFWKK